MELRFNRFLYTRMNQIQWEKFSGYLIPEFGSGSRFGPGSNEQFGDLAVNREGVELDQDQGPRCLQPAGAQQFTAPVD